MFNILLLRIHKSTVELDNVDVSAYYESKLSESELSLKDMIAKSRKEKREDTHRKLIDSAMKHFELDGISGARTIDIANTAGVSHGTVFLHFPTRDELLVTVMHDFGMRVTRKMRADIDADMGIRTVLKTHLATLSEYEDLYARLISELNTLPEDVQVSVVSIHSAISHSMYSAAKTEMEKGLIKRMPMSFLFTTWIGLIHHYLQNKRFYCVEGSLLKKRGYELVDNYMNLISERNWKDE